MSKRSKSKRKHDESSESEAESSESEAESSAEEDSSDEEVIQKTLGSKSRAKRSKVTRSKRRKSPEVEDDSGSSDDEGPSYKDRDKSPRSDVLKWDTLRHNGPVFAPPYIRLPKKVHFEYDGKVVRLSDAAEEVAGFYARLSGHEYLKKATFKKNFFKDWQSVMTSREKKTIVSLAKCDFDEMNEYFKKKAEEKKEMSKEAKLEIKERKQMIENKYGYCVMDGREEKIGNFYVEPPGLFRGRGDHPKMGMLKTRVQPEDVIINCGKNSKAPVPPRGHKWKEIRHDRSVSWLASWTENIQGQVKYIMLNQSSGLKIEKDWRKYEKARELADHIDRIRKEYRKGWASSDARVQQCSVALYFIDKLALRAGNEKSEDTADTVGCCSLRCEHVKLHDNGKSKVVAFNFLGKDSIPYKNAVNVEDIVFKNLKRFLKSKKARDELFHKLNTAVLNKHLSGFMEGLTAKVFRTYNASHTLQEQLNKLTPKNGTVAERIFAYNRANRAVAVLCNHQRAVPKTYENAMQNLGEKIRLKRLKISEVEREFKRKERTLKNQKQSKRTRMWNKKKKSKKELRKHKQSILASNKKMKSLNALKVALAKLEITRTDKKEGKDIALGTSKLNYLDPRITVAWCKKWNIKLEKLYNKTQRAKFQWAFKADKNFRFD